MNTYTDRTYDTFAIVRDMAASDGSATNPNFATESEALVWEALRSQLLPGETVLTGLRFSDVKYGDVEADMIVLFPDAGAVVLEVKGGSVSYSDGEYRVTSGRGTRRAHPFAQARKAKHALRRFLDRQPEWDQPLLRAEWMVVLPFMEVDGDLGPEGRRDLIIDRSQLGRMRDLMHARISSPLHTDPYPTGEWADTALTLLLRFKDHSARNEVPPGSPTRRSRTKSFGIAAVVVAAVAGLALLGFRQLHPSDPPVTPAKSVSGNCNPNYSPCLPIAVDLDCPEIATVVTVIKSDPYDLDRDGDGTACETYG